MEKHDHTEAGCCCEKNTLRTAEEKKKLMNRLSRIEGQVRGIKGMLEKDLYCTDILIQSAAVNAAVNAFNKDLLAMHIKNCVVDSIKNDEEGVIEDLMDVIKRLIH